MKSENPADPDFYDITTMTPAKAFARGFHQGQVGSGPFGIWSALENDPTPTNADLVSQWLHGWSKGRQVWLHNQQRTPESYE